MNAPDIDQDAALADITLICHQCKAALDSEDLPEGQPRFSDSGYFVALANEAYRRGWLIEYNGPHASYFDYRIFCPECARQKPPKAQMRFRLRTLLIAAMFGPPVLAFAWQWPGVVMGLLAMSPLAMLPVLIYRTVEYLLAASRRGQAPQD